MPTKDNYIGTNIKKARLKAGYTQESLAEQIDVSSSVVSRLETGRTMVSVAKLQEIADVLDTFIGYFFITPEFIAHTMDKLNTDAGTHVSSQKNISPGSASKENPAVSDNYPEFDDAAFLEAQKRNLTVYLSESGDITANSMDEELYHLIEKLPKKSKEFFKRALQCYLEIF